jgi:uncharacterized membrane protein YraQ (UPF0718 family)
MDDERLRQAAAKTGRSLLQSGPVLLGALLLVGLAKGVVPPAAYARVFTGNGVLDALIGAVVGSVSAGNPIVSYVVGGELLAEGVGLVAVTAFLLSWVSVGVVQIPVEGLLLGRRFALVRNGVSFGMAIVIALLTALTLSALP